VVMGGWMMQMGGSSSCWDWVTHSIELFNLGWIKQYEIRVSSFMRNTMPS